MTELPVVLNGHGCEKPQGVKAGDRCERFVVVHAAGLSKTSCDETCLESFDRPIGLDLDAPDPFAANDGLILGTWYIFPGAMFS